MCISSVGSFPMHSGGSLIIFPVLLGVRILALHGKNFLHFIRYRHISLLAYLVGIWRGGMSVSLSIG